MRFGRVLLSAFVVLAGSVAAVAERIPVETLFRQPEFRSFQVSPDGSHLAVIGPWEERGNLFVYDLESGDVRRVTAFTDNQVESFMWANDERLIFWVSDEGYPSVGMFAVNKDGRRSRVLVPAGGAANPWAYTDVIHRLPDDREHVLVINNDRRLSYPDVYRLNIYREPRHLTRRARGGTVFAGVEVERNPGKVVGWGTDYDGNVRIATTSDPEEGTSVLVRPEPGGEWIDMAAFEHEAPSWSPLGISDDGKTLFVVSNMDEDRAGIYTIDLKTGEIGDRLYGNETYDVSAMRFSRFRRAPVAITYHTERPQVRWLDEEKRLVQEALDNAFPDTHNAITSMSDDESVMVVTSSSDRHAPFFNLVRIKEGRLSVTPLGESRPWLDPEELAPMRPVQYESRDGLTIHGYLTMPPGWSEGDDPVPLVVNPHGGPWARDLWGFYPEVQFFASRGYGVLRVNFRGSTGYGRKHLRAGDRTWGTDMQNDVVDGVRWAIAEGYADESRIGIHGASYGGYTVMMQLVQHPDMYRWGINFVGPVDLPSLIRHRRNHENVYGLYSRTIGDPEADMDLLSDFSPVNHVDKLQAPVFIVHGSNDLLVPIDQATTLRSAMRRAGKEFEWLVKSDEGHGFQRQENIFELYHAIESFVEEHF